MLLLGALPFPSLPQVQRLEGELEVAVGRRNPKAAAKAAHGQGSGGANVDRLARQELAEMEEARRAATEQLTVGGVMGPKRKKESA